MKDKLLISMVILIILLIVVTTVLINQKGIEDKIKLDITDNE